MVRKYTWILIKASKHTALLQVVDARQVELLVFSVHVLARLLRAVPRHHLVAEPEALVEEGLETGRAVSRSGRRKRRGDCNATWCLFADVVVILATMKMTPWSVVR